MGMDAATTVEVRAPAPSGTGMRGAALLERWLRAQAINVGRHRIALRPFARDEFAAGPAAPSSAHIQAANRLLTGLRSGLSRHTRAVTAAAAAAQRDPTPANLERITRAKAVAHRWVMAVERIWDFYFELFGQRQSRYGTWLLGTDRIAADCYQAAFMGVGTARSIPSPPPFCYMRTGFSPATFRRSLPLRRLGLQRNPFPLIQLPYHRLVNPWTLGAVLHETGHSLQNDLGVQRAVPRTIFLELRAAGVGVAVAAAWVRWNRELFADLLALLLGGPAIVASLLDVLALSPEVVRTYISDAPHPPAYLRALVSFELLRRMGFARMADQYRAMWTRLYPDPRVGNLPPALLKSFPEAAQRVVAAIAFHPYGELGERSLTQMVRFGVKEEQWIEEAARRLASGDEPGIIPERFLIGAARFALDQRLAAPEMIRRNFYAELLRR